MNPAYPKPEAAIETYRERVGSAGVVPEGTRLSAACQPPEGRQTFDGLGPVPGGVFFPRQLIQGLGNFPSAASSFRPSHRRAISRRGYLFRLQEAQTVIWSSASLTAQARCPGSRSATEQPYDSGWQRTSIGHHWDDSASSRSYHGSSCYHAGVKCIVSPQAVPPIGHRIGNCQGLARQVLDTIDLVFNLREHGRSYQCPTVDLAGGLVEDLAGH